MNHRELMSGNEAVAVGAAEAGCSFFTGYPITPQNEITEWFARELPKRGGVFLQSESETGSIQILLGAAVTGVRAMTSTASMGWALMQEGISDMVSADLPCVIVNVQRAGPGGGNIHKAQMDYLTATRGGGHGGYKNIVLAPASVQECCDLTQLAFYLADKYCNPVIVLSDAVIGHMEESVEVKALDFGPVPPKDWALVGKANRKDGQRRGLNISRGSMPEPQNPNMTYLGHMEMLDRKFKAMAAAEVRYDTYQIDDAKLVLVAYGSSARTCRKAVDLTRAKGLKVGLLRPITLWPFPTQPIKEKAKQGVKFLVVEDSLGQLIDDVQLAVEGRAEVHLLGMLARHIPGPGGFIFPNRIVAEIEKLYG